MEQTMSESHPCQYGHTPDHIPTRHGEKGHCRVCLEYDYVAETVGVNASQGVVVRPTHWTPSAASEILARKMHAGLLPAAPAAPPPAPSESAAGPAGSDTTSLTSDQAAVLKTLLGAGGVTMTVEMIVDKVSLSDRTVRTVLKSLRDLGLAVEPTPKKGHCLTPEGHRRTLELPADAGASLLKPESKPGR
jgi:hypothetical protein